MQDWHSIRASDADRERAADLLKAAMSEGRLTWAEYTERLDKLMASKYYGDIQRVIADIPTGFGTQLAHPSHPAQVQQPQHPMPMVPHRSTEPLATASLVCGVLVPFTCAVSALPAIITGHMAIGRLNQTGDPGRGMAIAGLILGYLPIALMMLGVFGWITLST